tara:strand:- start:491 stop:727 length:237 start_codon:yes stop_codon:yes gene_type:complete
MRYLVIISLLIFSFTGKAYSYSESQMEDCVCSATNNPATKTIPKISITNYCDCVLEAIIDQKKTVRESGYECARIHFN